MTTPQDNDQATPRPWVILDYDNGSLDRSTAPCQIVGADGTVVYAGPYCLEALRGDTPQEAQANAALIVQAVNSHEALVEALRGFLEQWEIVEPAVNAVIGLQSARGYPYTGPNVGNEIEAMKKALALAEGTRGGHP